MKSIVVAFICGVSLIISAAIVGSAIKSYGGSLERAASNQPRNWSMPTTFTFDVRFRDGGSPVRLDVNTKAAP